MKKVLLRSRLLTGVLLLSGCAPRPPIQLNEHGVGPTADVEVLEPSFVDVQYDGYVLSGTFMLYAMLDAHIPHVLDWRTLSVQRIWPCDHCCKQVEDGVHIDYAPVEEPPRILFLRKGDFHGRRLNVPLFAKTYTPQGGPSCIRYELVYASDGNFRGPYTLSIMGEVSRTDKASSEAQPPETQFAQPLSGR